MMPGVRNPCFSFHLERPSPEPPALDAGALRGTLLRVLAFAAACAALLLVAIVPPASAAKLCTRHYHPRGCVRSPADLKPRARQQGPAALTPQDAANGGGIGAGPGLEAANAITWAQGEKNAKKWASYCERFVEESFGIRGRFPSANAAAVALKPRKTAFSKIPVGSLVFFRSPKKGGPGHVGLWLGNGKMISALSTVHTSQVARGKPGRYWRQTFRGWAPAPDAWPGRIPPPPGSTAEYRGATVRITAPALTQTISGLVELHAASAGAAGVTFQAYYAADPAKPASRSWHLLGRGTRPAKDDWSFTVNTTTIPNQDDAALGEVNIAAIATKSNGKLTSTRDYRRIGVYNLPVRKQPNVERILTTKDRYAAGHDSWALRTNGTKFVVSAACRDSLIASGIKVQVLDQPVIDAIPDGTALPCAAITLTNNIATSENRVLTPPEGREQPNQGWVEQPDGTIFYVQPECRGHLIADGMPTTVLSFAEINAKPGLAAPADCASIPTPHPHPVTDVQRILTTSDKYAAANDSWLLRADGTKTHITSACRARLIALGMPVQIRDYPVIASLTDGPDSDCFNIQVPDPQPPAGADRLVVPGDKREMPNDGWVQQPDGTKFSVSAECRTHLANAGMPTTQVPYATITAMTDTAAPDCGSIPTPAPHTVSDVQRILTTFDKYAAGNDSWLLRADGTKTSVPAACRDRLIGLGMPVEVRDFAAIDRIPAGAGLVDCLDVQIPSRDTSQYRIVIPPEKHELPADGWVQQPNGMKFSVNAECRSHLTDDGMTTTVVAYTAIAAMPSVDPPDCGSLPVPSPHPLNGLQRILTTTDKYAAGNDAWVMRTDGTKLHLSAACRDRLISQGMPVQVRDFSAIQQIPDGPEVNDCFNAQVPSQTTTDVNRLIVPIDKRELPNDGWVERPDGKKYYVASDCRAHLTANGMPTVVLAYAGIAAKPDVTPPDCASISTPYPHPITADKILTTKDKYATGNDSWLASPNGTKLHVNATCRDRLIGISMPLQVRGYATSIQPLPDGAEVADCYSVTVPDPQRTTVNRVVMTADKREQPNSGWVQQPDGRKFAVDADCRGQLIANGMIATVLPSTQIDAMPLISTPNCNDIPIA